MNLLVINHFGNGQVVESDFIPQIGAKVDMFYKPMPKVVNVLAWPSKETLRSVNAENINISAIVFCE